MTHDHELLQVAQLFDFVEDVLVWIKDRSGKYRWVNRAFQLQHESSCSQCGPGAAQILGKTDYDLSPAFLADQFRFDDEYVLTGKRIVNRIELVTQPDGPPTWNITNKIPLFDKKGTVIGTAGLTRCLSSEESDSYLDAGFCRVLGHIRDHYQEPLTNQHLASVAHMSVRAFERNFLRTFHLTPQQYLRKIRMHMASRALVFTAHSLAKVAQGCGFSDQSHFTREFRKHFGRTPRDYREFYTRNGEFAASGTNSAAAGQ